MSLPGPAPFDSLSLVSEDYQNELEDFFSDDMLNSRVGFSAENKSFGLHIAYAHLCELLTVGKLTDPLVREFFDSFAIIENCEKINHYTVLIEPIPAQTPLKQYKAPIQSAMSVQTYSAAAKHLTSVMLGRIKSALGTDEQICIPDLLGSSCDGSCNISHGRISWSLGRAVTLFLRKKLEDKDYVIDDLSLRVQNHKAAHATSPYVREADVLEKLNAAGVPFMPYSKNDKGGGKDTKGQQHKSVKDSPKSPATKSKKGRDEPYCVIKAGARKFQLTKGPVQGYFERWAEEVKQLLTGKGEFEDQSHCPLMLKGQRRPVCARTDLKGFQYNSCGATPCVMAQLLRNSRAKEWIIEVFAREKFDASAVYDLLVENLSADGIIDHGKLLKQDLTPLLLSTAASAATLPDNSPAAEPPVSGDMHATLELLQAKVAAQDGQLQELMSVSSGGSASYWDDGSVVGSGGSVSGWDSASVGSSVASGVSRSDGGNQRVAAAGVSRTPGTPPARVFGAAAGDGSQLMGVNRHDYQQFMAYKAAKALGKGRGRGGYGGRTMLPPLQHPNQN